MAQPVWPDSALHLDCANGHFVLRRVQQQHLTRKQKRKLSSHTIALSHYTGEQGLCLCASFNAC